MVPAFPSKLTCSLGAVAPPQSAGGAEGVVVLVARHVGHLVQLGAVLVLLARLGAGFGGGEEARGAGAALGVLEGGTCDGGQGDHQPGVTSWEGSRGRSWGQCWQRVPDTAGAPGGCFGNELCLQLPWEPATCRTNSNTFPWHFPNRSIRHVPIKRHQPPDPGGDLICYRKGSRCGQETSAGMMSPPSAKPAL